MGTVILPTVLLTIPIAMLALVPPCGPAPEPCPQTPAIVVFVEAGNLPGHILVRAKHVAAKILATAGVSLHWIGAKPAGARLCPNSCPKWLEIELKDCAGATIPSEPMAVSRIHPRREPEIEVFLDRICQMVHSQQLPELLGHVLAHEIVHVLQGIKRHSEDGLMKAKWTRRDIMEMAIRPLKLTAQDIELVQAYWVGNRVETAP